MAITTIANMQIVPEKFSQYVTDRTTEKSAMVNSGIATPDATVAALINGTPEGGRFIQLPMWNPLDGEEDVFGEADVSIGGITTKEARTTLLMRQRAWGATDLAHVLGGADPMAAIANLIADWRNIREQKIYLSILNAILDPTNGALKAHVNNVSGATGDKSLISVGNTLDTKQALGDAAGNLGMVFMHSATYTELQKNQQIATEYDATLQISIQTYLGYNVVVDDSMPVIKYATASSTTTGALEIVADTATPTSTQIKLSDVVNGGLPDAKVGDYVTKLTSATYATYFLGYGAFIRQDGTPAGFIGTETDRDKIGAKNYLINRWCQIIHPRGFSWVSNGVYTDTTHYYPANVDLSKPANWELVTDHKKVPIACLLHKLSV